MASLLSIFIICLYTECWVWGICIGTEHKTVSSCKHSVFILVQNLPLRQARSTYVGENFVGLNTARQPKMGPLFNFYRNLYLSVRLVMLCFVVYKPGFVGWDSSVGIATRCGLDGTGIESR